MPSPTPLVLDFDAVGRDLVAVVGGKNALLGELRRGLAQAGIASPAGFALTVEAYHRFIGANALAPVIARELEAFSAARQTLSQTGAAIRTAIVHGSWPNDVAQGVRTAYAGLCAAAGSPAIDVAVRSSATYEDLPGASFAGQHDTFLNIRGAEALLDACKRCLASLFTDRAIAYREAKGFDHAKAALSVGVQRMVRADSGAVGVMFSIDPDTGFPNVAVINAAWGLGESIVQGEVDPDEYHVFKPLLGKPGRTPIVVRKLGAKAHRLAYTEGGGTVRQDVPAGDRERSVLSDAEALTLGRWAQAIESHYGAPMDISGRRTA